jgi:HAMP domain-containing protein
MTSAQQASNRKSTPSTQGMTLFTRLMVSFLSFIAVLGVLMVIVYQIYVPDLVRDQVELRAESVSRSFAAAVLQPAVERDYLRVNRTAETTADLPGVAFAAVVNQRGIPIAGIFGDMEPFDSDFAELVKQRGFPRDLLDETVRPAGDTIGQTRVVAGGREMLVYTQPLEEIDGEVHIGLFTAGIAQAVRTSLIPLLILLVIMAVFGSLGVFFIARAVSRPIQRLSEQAELISKGQLDREINIKASGEVGQLVESFRRMQAAIKYLARKMRDQRHETTPSGDDV